MNRLIGILSIILILSLAGCTSYGKKHNDLETQYTSAKSEEVEKAKPYITGTVDALGALNDNEKTPETDLAEELAKDAQSIIGAPNQENRINVKELLSQNQSIKDKAWRLLEKKRKDDIKARQKLEDLREELDAVKSKLVEKGIEKEKEDNRNIVSRVWHWAIGTFGLLGGIAFIFFCPTIAIPLLLAVLKWIIGLIPQLMGFFQVVGSSVVSNIVEGIHKVKTQVKDAPANTTYTREQVLEMLKTQLGTSTDKTDKNIIEHLEDKIKLKEAKENL